MSYPELKQGLHKFRELIHRRMLPQNVLNGNLDFLKRIIKQEAWTQSEAFQIYNIIAI